MALADELETYVSNTFRADWSKRDGRGIPNTESITLDNTAVHFDPATILYADLAASTKMVDKMRWWFASEIYKNYLYCCSRLIRSNSGEVVAFDGDRVMGVFLGDTQTSDAAKCALQINYAVEKIITPKQALRYPNSSFVLKQSVGIDCSEVYVSRTGVRGSNDLVWVGRAPNYAAKLNDLSSEGSTWITESVFKNLSQSTKFGGSPQRLMWEARLWTKMNNMRIYRSNWSWKI